MKPPIFFDHSFSYHPLPSIQGLVHKEYPPHAFSPCFQSAERAAREDKAHRSLRDKLGISTASLYYLTASHQEALEKMFATCYLQEIFHSGKNHILVSELDRVAFRPIENKWRALGVEFRSIPLSEEGHITEEMLKKSITPRTALVAFSWVNPLTGVIQPAYDIAKYCSAQEILVHVDMSHIVGKLYCTIQDLPADYITCAARSFRGPHDIGIVIGQHKGSIEANASFFLHQLEAVEAAVSHANATIDEMHLEVTRLRTLFEKKLAQKIPGAQVVFQHLERLPSVTVIAFPKVHGEYLTYLLAESKLYASFWDDQQTSLEEVLTVMHVSPEIASSAVSFAFSQQTTEVDIEEAIARLFSCYQQTKALTQGIP